MFKDSLINDSSSFESDHSSPFESNHSSPFESDTSDSFSSTPIIAGELLKNK